MERQNGCYEYGLLDTVFMDMQSAGGRYEQAEASEAECFPGSTRYHTRTAGLCCVGSREILKIGTVWEANEKLSMAEGTQTGL